MGRVTSPKYLKPTLLLLTIVVPQFIRRYSRYTERVILVPTIDVESPLSSSASNPSHGGRRRWRRSGAVRATGPREGIAAGDGGAAAVTSVLRRWKREDLVEKSSLLLRAAALLLSLISFVVMASNKHGDWKEFDHYEEYRYIVAIGVLAFLYSAGQVARQVHRLNGGADPFPERTSRIVDFAADQVIAYLMISALSAAIPITNRMREGADNIFTDTSSASISMAFFAFLALAFSALLSGFKLSKQTYI
ncbi:CASP-like protein 4B4 [Ananas comosus]|uniref:CASP-like protein n=1 Tax=Ananas comosus TaxID=4615 RepID=A0A6P5GIX4_ANACO|nr:CASP-like protein 4B4 [Ananas comosus]